MNPFCPLGIISALYIVRGSCRELSNGIDEVAGEVAVTEGPRTHMIYVYFSHVTVQR